MTEIKIKELTNKYVKIAIITTFDYLKRNINTSREIRDIKKEKNKWHNIKCPTTGRN